MQMISSRERVSNTLERKPNDRVPYHFRAQAEVYAVIKAAAHLTTDEEVRRWAHSDIRDLGAIYAEGGYGYTGFGWRDRILPDGSQEDLWGVRRRTAHYEGGDYLEICCSPLQRASLAEVRSYKMPDPRQVYDFSPLQMCVRELNVGDDFWCMIEVESLFDRCWNLRGMEQFLEDLLLEPDLADRLLSRMADFFFRRTHMILAAADGCLDGVALYNDFGTQTNSLIDPALFREFIKPKQKRLIEMVKNFGVKVFYHSCGAVEPFYHDLIELGVDIIDPLQLAAFQMSPAKLKRRYGDRVAFHGGVDIQQTLPYASPAEVRQHVQRLVGSLGDNGGYIVSGSHLYQVDTPLANIEAVHQSLIDL